MDVAELYLSMIRPNGVPVVGECMADGFIGQIQVERWNWNLQNDEEIKKGTEAEEKYTKHKGFLDQSVTADLQQELLQINDTAARKKSAEAYNKSDAKLNQRIDELRNKARAATGKDRLELDKQLDEMLKEQRDAKSEYDKQQNEANESLNHSIAKLYVEGLKDRDRRSKDDKKLADEIEDVNKRIQQRELENKSYEFSFSKRVDFATTQLLNSMKAGDVFPMAVLTIHQRSSNAGMSLVFTVTQLRLLDYAVRAEVTETMTDMKEQWKAEFHSLAYVYKNRKSIEGGDSGSEAAAKLATQGTVRTFAMKKDLGF